MRNELQEVGGMKRKKGSGGSSLEIESIKLKRKKFELQKKSLTSKSVVIAATDSTPTENIELIPLAEDATSIKLTAEGFRRLHQLQISGDDNFGKPYGCPDPMTSFDLTPFAKSIRKALDTAGFANPTPTQAQVWPIAIAGRDVITVAKTGSGKTCGFLLPAFHRFVTYMKDRKRGLPGILVLAPTRELALQIEEECVKFGKSSDIRSVCVFGGAPKSSQVRKIQSGIEVLVATPGRLNDILDIKAVDLSQVGFLVLDEADRMLDMGFEPQIRKIIEKLPAERQSMMFTATWPRGIKKIAREFMRNPIEIKFGEGDTLNANSAIVQDVRVIKEAGKTDELKKILQLINPSGSPEDMPKTIIFVSRKKECDNLGNEMWNAGFPVDSLHGDKDQHQRTKAMDMFKKTQIRVLVATDIAARGLDVKDIEVVINFDFPGGPSGVEDYVHRIGRTARASAEGRAYTFFTSENAKHANQLIGVLERAGQVVSEELKKLDRGVEVAVEAKVKAGGWGTGSSGGRGGDGRGRGGDGRGRGGDGRGRGGDGRGRGGDGRGRGGSSRGRGR